MHCSPKKQKRHPVPRKPELLFDHGEDLHGRHVGVPHAGCVQVVDRDPADGGPHVGRDLFGDASCILSFVGFGVTPASGFKVANSKAVAGKPKTPRLYLGFPSRCSSCQNQYGRLYAQHHKPQQPEEEN